MNKFQKEKGKRRESERKWWKFRKCGEGERERDGEGEIIRFFLINDYHIMIFFFVCGFNSCYLKRRNLIRNMSIGYGQLSGFYWLIQLLFFLFHFTNFHTYSYS